MADYVTTKEVVGYGLLGIGAVITGLGVWIGVSLSNIKQQLKQNDIQNSKQLHRMLDQTLDLVKSVKANTIINNRATGGNAND